jgi:hypothetical protein
MAVVTEYKGAHLAHVFRSLPLTTTVAVDKHLKLVFNGPVCVDHLTDSYKYDEEVHIITYQKTEPEAAYRVTQHNGYYRVEMHLSVNVFEDLVRAWLDYKKVTMK